MRIWFNHWFSTAYHIINLIKSEYPNAYIIGTNDKENCVYKTVCDMFTVEPIFKDPEEYIRMALQFCKVHGIDVFFPRRYMVDIAKHKSEFERINVKLILSADYETMKLFNDKGLAYKDLKTKNLCQIPDFEIVNTVADFTRAYTKLKQKNERVIFKYSIGEGATSFRVIDDKVKDLAILDTGAGMKLSLEDAISLFSTNEPFKDLLMMPYLKGPEISIDCINLPNQFIGICRKKLGSRVTQIYQDNYLLEISKNIAKEYNIYGPFNIQFREHNGVPYLLEINTRMSGGVHLSCLTGVNIPSLAIKKACNESINFIEYNKTPILASQIETPIML